MKGFLDEGNTVVRGVFGWIVEDAELMRMVHAKLEVYRRHLREQNGRPNLGEGKYDTRWFSR